MGKRTPLIIDFIGLAGAGKTHVKNRLLSRLSADFRCVDLSDVRISTDEGLNFCLAEPEICLASLKIVCAKIPRRCVGIIRGLRKWLKFQVQVKKAAGLDCDAVFLDEGFVYMLGWITNHGWRELSFREVLNASRRKFYAPDLTIVVTADFDLVENRKKIRARARARKYRPVASKNTAAAKLEILQKRLTAAREAGLIGKILYYENNGAFDLSLADNIAAAIRQRQAEDGRAR
jgi:hypothetical protein